ncbi:MAG: hypothetical protein ACYC4L_09880 [Chloroflexota bacterium]
MISNPDQAYEAVHEIMRALDVAGDWRWSEALSDALKVGGTGTEVLGEVRLTLRKIIKDGAAERSGKEDLIDEVMRYIYTIWGPMPADR